MPDNRTFAEYLKIEPHYLYRKPSHLSFHEAAAIPLAGLTAWRLMTRAGLRPGEKVLIIGIGGGVAMMAFQLAVAFGAEVWVTSGSKKQKSNGPLPWVPAGELFTGSLTGQSN